jgi:hypothetical protein
LTHRTKFRVFSGEAYCGVGPSPFLLVMQTSALSTHTFRVADGGFAGTRVVAAVRFCLALIFGHTWDLRALASAVILRRSTLEPHTKHIHSTEVHAVSVDATARDITADIVSSPDRCRPLVRAHCQVDNAPDKHARHEHRRRDHATQNPTKPPRSASIRSMQDHPTPRR